MDSVGHGIDTIDRDHTSENSARTGIETRLRLFPMDLTVGAVAAMVAATAIGATLQGSLGFGMNLVSVPVFALVLPAALPVTVIVLGIPIAIWMVRYERHAIDRVGVGWIIAGRVPGTIVGAWVVATVSTSMLQSLAGAIVLLLVVGSVAMPPFRVRPESQVGAGIVSGFTGTSAGIGGPPLALLYQHHPGSTMRSTLGFVLLRHLAVIGHPRSCSASGRGAAPAGRGTRARGRRWLSPRSPAPPPLGRRVASSCSSRLCGDHGRDRPCARDHVNPAVADSCIS